MSKTKENKLNKKRIRHSLNVFAFILFIFLLANIIFLQEVKEVIENFLRKSLQHKEVNSVYFISLLNRILSVDFSSNLLKVFQFALLLATIFYIDFYFQKFSKHLLRKIKKVFFRQKHSNRPRQQLYILNQRFIC